MSPAPGNCSRIMQWIMEGNRGLVYVRVMRTPSGGALRRRFRVRIRQGLYRCGAARRTPPSSSAAAAACMRRWRRPPSAPSRGVNVGVVDMPSIDEAAPAGVVRFRQAALFRRAEQRLHLAELPDGPVSTTRIAWTTGRAVCGEHSGRRKGGPASSIPARTRSCWRPSGWRPRSSREAIAGRVRRHERTIGPRKRYRRSWPCPAGICAGW